MHYNERFQYFWWRKQWQVYYQPGCLMRPYDQKCWPLQFPNIDNWTDNSVIIMHCQDFVSIDEMGCPELREMEQHFGDLADHVIVIHWNYGLERVYSGPMHLIYYPTHESELLTNLKRTQHIWQPELQKPRLTNWQCLNGAVRPHRRRLAEIMKTIPNGILSLGDEIPLKDWPYSTYRGCENEDNWTRLLPVYSDCDINIVCETQFLENPGIISEKTTMAFLALQVPIFVGYPGIVGHLREMGFDLFDDIVDHSYDLVEGYDRIAAAVERNRHLLDSGIDRASLLPRLQANQDYLLSGWFDWFNCLLDQRMLEIHNCLTKQ